MDLGRQPDIGLPEPIVPVTLHPREIARDTGSACHRDASHLQFERFCICRFPK